MWRVHHHNDTGYREVGRQGASQGTKEGKNFSTFYFCRNNLNTLQHVLAGFLALHPNYRESG